MISGNFGELLLLKAADPPNSDRKSAGKQEAAEYSIMRRPRLPNAQKSCYMGLKIRAQQRAQPAYLRTDTLYRTSLNARVTR